MPVQQITNGKDPVSSSALRQPAGGQQQRTVGEDEQIRELAVKQIERRRRFHVRVIFYAAASIVLIAIWAITEFSNAGGWPTSGFSQSSSIPHEWNIWIIYPLLGFALALAIDAWNTYGRRPIGEREIQREVDRLTGTH
jgi:protein-S-isoprenylcysteine O-methyltransferase Ste14